MNWDVYKAKRWMMDAGMDHIRDGLPTEGGELIYQAKFGDGCDTREKFFNTIRKICWWDKEDIEETIQKIMG